MIIFVEMCGDFKKRMDNINLVELRTVHVQCTVCCD